MKNYTIPFLILVTTLFSCKNKEEDTNQKLKVVTTTSMITDIVKNIGGNLVSIEGLMGTGVDPHLYKASEGDVSKLFNADVIFYNGLHLEGKLVEIFEKMQGNKTKTIAVGEILDKNILIDSEYFASNYDPHIWFDIQNWKQVTTFIVKQLKELDPKNGAAFETKGKTYIEKLDALEKEIKNIIAALPVEKRILVTAHDAFNYFGKAYDFKVVGLQGLSTATEAGVQDVQKLAAFIIDHKVKSIFVESSVPKRTIEALQASVKAKNHDVTIGGTLFSDALGNPDSAEGTYIGMFEYNVRTIVNALK